MCNISQNNKGGITIEKRLFFGMSLKQIEPIFFIYYIGVSEQAFTQYGEFICCFSGKPGDRGVIFFRISNLTPSLPLSPPALSINCWLHPLLSSSGFLFTEHKHNHLHKSPASPLAAVLVQIPAAASLLAPVQTR